jgi:hypothetical protein
MSNPAMRAERMTMATCETCVDDAVCTACGGKCCQHYAGGYHPDDLAPVTAESLARRFADGIYAIDWWEGDVRPGKTEWSTSMFIRPAHVGVTSLRDPAWSGLCTHWSPVDGCCFEPQHRPRACREIVPKKGGDCIGPFDKEATALAWAPYQDTIREAEALARQP